MPLFNEIMKYDSIKVYREDHIVISMEDSENIYNGMYPIYKLSKNIINSIFLC